MEKYIPYDCKQCGACCRHVNFIPEMKAYDRGDGVCRHLRRDHRCEIYTHRPNICNGKYVYEHYFSDMTVAEFHQMIARYCKKIREEQGLEGLHQNEPADR